MFDFLKKKSTQAPVILPPQLPSNNPPKMPFVTQQTREKSAADRVAQAMSRLPEIPGAPSYMKQAELPEKLPEAAVEPSEPPKVEETPAPKPVEVVEIKPSISEQFVLETPTAEIERVFENASPSIEETVDSKVVEYSMPEALEEKPSQEKSMFTQDSSAPLFGHSQIPMPEPASEHKKSTLDSLRENLPTLPRYHQPEPIAYRHEHLERLTEQLNRLERAILAIEQHSVTDTNNALVNKLSKALADQDERVRFIEQSVTHQDTLIDEILKYLETLDSKIRERTIRI